MKNRFNDLTGKEWLPFQKSFTHFTNFGDLYQENIRFFTKPSNELTPVALFSGSSSKEILFQSLCEKDKIHYGINNLDYIYIDLTDELINLQTKDQMESWLQITVNEIIGYSSKLLHRKFISILINNINIQGKYYPIAWELSNRLAQHYTRKDEKIICRKKNQEPLINLYFRKDEDSAFDTAISPSDLWNSIPDTTSISSIQVHPNWFMLRPKPRKKDEILHPAKYPEELVSLYLNTYSRKGDNVFDPMSGTGTTQVESLKLSRNGYGVELSSMFHSIAVNRCAQVDSNSNQWSIFEGDARNWTDGKFPTFDYMITSPPYWDMLNMQGAENQALRKKKGLQTNYSDNEKDLGNIDDYYSFLNDLVKLYISIITNLKEGGYFTIVVKNIKKKGKIYPFAFDLVSKLSPSCMLSHVGYWCQDDLRLAPYGFGNTWVSNTFHHYCLTFKKMS